LNDIVAYAGCYSSDPATVDAIVDAVLGENVFVRRYLGWRALPSEA